MNTSEILIARQPIYSRSRQVTAYELLYRDSEVNAFNPAVDGTYATRNVITQALLNFGMDLLTEGRQGYVNFTEPLIREKLPLLLEKENFVIEVLESVPLSPSVLACLMEFREKGFTVALDDYDGAPLTKEQLACFDIIKIDFMLTTADQRREIAKALRAAKKTILAEKVETEDEFQEALALGCALFQGYYFARPRLMRKQKHAIASVSAARLTGILSRSDYRIDDLVDIVRHDAHLTYKLFKKMDTMEYYRGNPVQSVRLALARMGQRGILRWSALVLMETYLDRNEDELLKTGLIRGRFCELMAEREGQEEAEGDAFLVGMFSILDVADQSGVSPLDELSLTPRVLVGLREQGNDLNRYLQTAISYERGSWAALDNAGLDGLAALYRKAVAYADNALTPEEEPS